MFSALRNKLFKIKDQIESKGVVEEHVKPTAKEKVKAAFKGEIILDEKKLDELFWDFEVALLEGDVAMEVSEKIIGDLKENLYGRKFKRSEDLNEAVEAALKSSLKNILVAREKGLIDLIKEKGVKPFVIVFIGVNGTGKTTTIAKVVRYLEKQGLTSVLAASDTYRAGAIEQLEIHAERLGVRMIKHDKGADPAAVAFDAIKHAEAKGKDCVLIDTAGRMETNVNLLEEMKKIVRISRPDLVLFVGDALTGNSAIDQAQKFGSAVNIDGVVLTKADADVKGGSAVSISYMINKPIFFLGTGQEYDDLVEFDPDQFIDELLAT
ncbi:MAG: signal recognition particle-docking protein FtsY [Candidatus Hydrothermarchaeales archaeon]